ncbi:MAG: Holliday junction branch migration protein RuvA [Balneolaceae bacterium]|nr:Holliday junction branch migration protein RuvA [Balneolaceae bacterium]
MIAYLKGTVTGKQENKMHLEVNGIGYEVEISTQTLQQLPDTGEEIRLLIHHHFTDNDQRLFGFYSKEEKELFELLITVKGVGPKLGLTILSGMQAPQITSAIVESDKAALSQISGIGKKTAERMILELKDKITEVASVPAGDTGKVVSGDLKQEAISALESLGFRKNQAEKAVLAAARDHELDGDVQQLVKKALTQLKR